MNIIKKSIVTINEALSSVIANPNLSSADLKPISSKDAVARADELEHDFYPISITTDEGVKKLQSYYSSIDLTDYNVQIYIDGYYDQHDVDVDDDTDDTNIINIYFYFTSKLNSKVVLSAWKSSLHLSGRSTDEILDSLVDELEEVLNIIKKLKLNNNRRLSDYSYYMKNNNYEVHTSNLNYSEALVTHSYNILPNLDYMKVIRSNLLNDYYGSLNNIVYSDSEGSHAIRPYAGHTESRLGQKAYITISGSGKWDESPDLLKWEFSISDYFDEYNYRKDLEIDLSNISHDQVINKLGELLEVSDRILEELDLRIESTNGNVDQIKSYEVVRDALRSISTIQLI